MPKADAGLARFTQSWAGLFQLKVAETTPNRFSKTDLQERDVSDT